jgi:nitroreductase
MSQRTRTLLTPVEVREVVTAATRAPSVHNTQPWLFSWDGAGFDLTADTSRGLTVQDPDGRELLISCGAALYNLRLALRKLGYDAVVTAAPSTDPRRLARVDVETGDPADAAERRLFAAINRRHTHRGGFEDRPLGAELSVALQRVAAEEGAMLLYVTDPGQRARVLHLARAADRELAADPRIRAEIEHWAPAPGTNRRDGIPATAYASEPHHAGRDELAIRDFDLDRGVGQLDESPEHPGVVAVLTTDRDVAAAWLSAGQALQRVLVTAAEHWAFAALHSQVTEVPHLRLELQRELCTLGVPQLMLRFGYADKAPTTPRRPVEDVLDDLTR